MENKIIYFDNAAKSIPYDEVINVYNEATRKYFANPSSIHFQGVKTQRIIDKCKDEIKSLLKMNNHQVVFTSSATEANNLAIKGFCLKYKKRGNHIITSEYEHPSVLEVLRQLEKEFGFEVTYLKPNKKGVIEVNDVINNIRHDTILVSIMAVNNEIGTINPISEIAKELKKYPKIVFHVDAAQAIGKIDIAYQDVDMVSISGHKTHGLVSSSALLIRKNLELLPLFSGGEQEYGYRSGTVDVAMALALLEAIKISLKDLKAHYEKVSLLADKLLNYLKNNPDLYEINGDSNPYIVNFSSRTKKGSVIVEALSRKGIMVSSTSACSSYKQKGSYVVSSLGKDDNISLNTIRVSFSYLNELEEVDEFIDALKEIIGAIR